MDVNRAKILCQLVSVDTNDNGRVHAAGLCLGMEEGTHCPPWFWQRLRDGGSFGLERKGVNETTEGAMHSTADE